LQKRTKKIILSFFFLAFAVIFSIVGSVSTIERIQFFNKITLKNDTSIFKIFHLINDTEFVSSSCQELNLTLIKFGDEGETWLEVYKINSSMSIRLEQGNSIVLQLQPSYNAYTFIFKKGAKSTIVVKSECFSVTYPHKYFSVFSIIFFIVGTTLLLDYMFRELPYAIKGSEKDSQ
jgi:hypothetical protein